MMIIERLSIRTLTGEQFGQIVEIEKNCGLEPYPPSILLACIRDMDTLACLDGGTVAGFITFRVSRRYLNGSLYIVNLNVAQPYRRQGIACGLILAACRQAPGVPVTLDVARNNTPAIRLYEKLGFEATSLSSANGSTDMVMALSRERAAALAKLSIHNEP